jgi:hypothetical protein
MRRGRFRSHAEADLGAEPQDMTIPFRPVALSASGSTSGEKAEMARRTRRRRRGRRGRVPERRGWSCRENAVVDHASFVSQAKLGEKIAEYLFSKYGRE